MCHSSSKGGQGDGQDLIGNLDEKKTIKSLPKEAINQHSTGSLSEEKEMLLLKQSWIPSLQNFTCHNKTKTQIFEIQVAALGTNLISQPWRSMREERGTPGSISCQEPPGFISSKEATEQDKIPSQAGCLPRRIHVEIGAAEALGVSGSPPGGHWWMRILNMVKQQGLRAEYLGMYTQTLQRMPHFIEITTGYLHLALSSPGHSSALCSLWLHLELFASQDLLIKQFSLSGKKNREVFNLKQDVIV